MLRQLALANPRSLCARWYSTNGSGSLKSIIPESGAFALDKTVEHNIQSDTNRLAKTLTRFWEKVGVHEGEKCEVQLDGKTLRTPLGFPLALPKSKRQLAHLIAHEWSNLPDLKIKTTNLPLTSIAARSIDLDEANKPQADEEIQTKVGNVEDIMVNLLRYFDTDTCLIFATKDEYEGKFRKMQDELYLPLIKEYEEYFTAYARKHTNFLPDGEIVKITFLDCETDGLRGNKQSLLVQNVVYHWMKKLPISDLVALEKAILTSKSFLCGVTLLRSNVSDPQLQSEIYQVNKSGPEEYYFKTAEEIIELGNLETIFQTAEWGEVEDTHDVDKEDWLRNITSAALLCH